MASGGFDPVFPDEGEWPAINPLAQDTRVTPNIVAGSITNDKLAGGISPTKFQGVGVKVYNTAVEEIADSTTTDLSSFDTVVFNQGFQAPSATAANPITVPFSGVYLIQLSTIWENNNTGGRTVRVTINGSTTEEDGRGANGTTGSFLTAVRKLTAGDTVGKQVRQSSGGPLDVAAGEAENSIAVIFLFPI